MAEAIGGDEEKLNVLVLQNEANEGLGIIKGLLDGLGREVTIVKVFDGEEVPAIIDEGSSKWSHLIVLGGTKSVVDGSQLERQLNDTISLIKDCFKKDVAVLGLCLGAQMMARALGAKVYKGKIQEVGWFKVEITKEGLEENNFSVFKSEEVFFQWHSDTFELPSCSEDGLSLTITPLATSELFENQAFCFAVGSGRRSYALQFHPEVDREMIDNWKTVIKGSMSKTSKNSGFVDFRDLSAAEENKILLDRGRNREFFLRFLRG